MPFDSLTSQQALRCRDNGRNDRAHTINDLGEVDMQLLIAVLGRQKCERCAIQHTAHNDSCIRAAIKDLPDHLRSHAGRVSRAWLRALPAEHRADVAELCPLHVQLRPELMYNIMRMFLDGERYVAAMVAQLRSLPGSDTDTEYLDRLAPLAKVAKASLMWTGSRTFKQTYPSCHRHARWRTQKDMCAACMVARVMKSTDLLCTFRSVFRIRCNDAAIEQNEYASNIRRITWIDNCLKQVLHPYRKQIFDRSAELEDWIKTQSSFLRPHRLVWRLSGDLDRTALANLVHHVQQRKMRVMNAIRYNTRSSEAAGTDARTHATMDHPPDLTYPLHFFPADAVSESSNVAQFELRNDNQPVLFDSSAWDQQRQHILYSPSVYSRRKTTVDVNQSPNGVPPPTHQSTMFLDDDDLNGELQVRQRAAYASSEPMVSSPPTSARWLLDAQVQHSPVSSLYSDHDSHRSHRQDHGARILGTTQRNVHDAIGTPHALGTESLSAVGHDLEEYLDRLQDGSIHKYQPESESASHPWPAWI